MFALVQNNTIWQLFEEDPELAEGLTVIDVSSVSGVAEGWIVAEDGSVTAPSSATPATLVPATVSARQFKLQLLADDLLDEVEAWVASQSKAVQISYASSGSFVRSEPMMASGFAAMNLTSDQIDEFFIAASKI